VRTSRRAVRGMALGVGLLVLLAGCGAAAEPTAGTHLLTGEITGMGGACYADVTGHNSMLSYDPMDGTVMFDGTELRPVMWPIGYSARMAGEQVLQVLDTHGQLVAQTGKFYSLVGRFHAGLFQTCLRGAPEEVKP
jgi:hypothetical protein